MKNRTDPDSHSEFALGLDLGGTVLKFGIVDQRGQTVYEDQLPSFGNQSRDAIRDQILKAVVRSREEAQSRGISIQGVGLGTPGTVDTTGCIQGELPNLPDWRGFPIVDFLKEISDDPVIVENDANLMAVAEARTGAGIGYSTVFGITFGTGIGGGFVVNDELYTGTGGAGEIGHTSVVPHGRSCRCGRTGCMERYGSVTAIEQTYQTRSGALLTIQAIIELWRAEDRLAATVMEESFMYSCIGIINMLQILRPECLILGGGLMEIDGAVFTSMARRLGEHMPEEARGTVAILKAAHGNRAGMIGAGIQALAVTGRDAAKDGRASTKQTRNTGGLR